MARLPLYRYPFDKEGLEVLTFAESIAAMRELERQLNMFLEPDWRWCDLRFKVVERHPTYAIYEVAHNDEYAGRAIVMPYCAEPPKIGPQSATAVRPADHRNRTRGEPEGA